MGLAAATAIGADRGARAAPAAGIACRTAQIGVLAPLTGGAARVGREQLDFARFALLTHGPTSRFKPTLVSADTRLSPPKAAAAAAHLGRNDRILVLVGPAMSREALAAAPELARRGLAFVSASAPRAALTRSPVRGFFRVIPSETAQAPTIAAYLRAELGARRVLVLDDGSAYGVPLADAIQANLRGRGAEVTREAAAPDESDLASLVAHVRPTTDAVVLAWQAAARATAFAQQLRTSGRRASVFGTDALDVPEFRPNSAYVSALLPDVRELQANEAFVKRYRARFGDFESRFAPPMYVATQVALTAVRNACRDGRASRAEVRAALRRTSLPRTILGWPVRFTPRGDLRNARFSVYRIENGVKRLVR